MFISIGIIGTKEIVNQIEEVLKTFPTFKSYVYIVESEFEIPAVAQKISEKVEVILISGANQSKSLKSRIKLTIPVHYLPFTEASLYKALLQASQTGKLEAGISVDTLTKTMVSRVTEGLGLGEQHFYVYNGPVYASADQLLAFHRGQINEKQCAIVLTGNQTVAKQLQDEGIFSIWLTPSSEDIIVTLERALLSTESRKNKEAQIVVGIMNVDNFEKLAMKKKNEHEVQLLKLDIQRTILSYVESLDGYMSHLGGDEYLFFTTRGIFERETRGYKYIQLAKDAKSNYNISLSIGVGFGLTANEAGTNAREALRKAKESGGNASFIVREDKSIIGPIEMSEPIKVTMAPLDQNLVKKAESAGMTSNYLSKLLTYMCKHQKYEYHVHEIAAILNITVRSAHRLLLVWLDYSLIEISRVEKVPKGRPRQMYWFRFIEQKAY